MGENGDKGDRAALFLPECCPGYMSAEEYRTCMAGRNACQIVAPKQSAGLVYVSLNSSPRPALEATSLSKTLVSSAPETYLIYLAGGSPLPPKG